LRARRCGSATARTLLAELSELGDASRQEIGALTAGYMAAFSAMRCDAAIRAFAKRLKAKGKPHKVVVVACIRKALHHPRART